VVGVGNSHTFQLLANNVVYGVDQFLHGRISLWRSAGRNAGASAAPFNRMAVSEPFAG
jgi:hypothetical protein